MKIVLGFDQLLQALAPTMTGPTFHSFVTILTGWVFAPRRTVTRMIRAAGDASEKHYSSYHRLFSAARWSLDAVGLAVFELMSPWLDEVVLVGIDDTLARKRGRKMFGVGMHHEPCESRHQLGTQLGRVGRDRRVAVSRRTLFLFAHSVSVVLEQKGGVQASSRVLHTAGVGGRVAQYVAQTPR